MMSDMKNFCLAVGLIFVLLCPISASPLVLNVTKNVSDNSEIELISFDATKYRQIRILLSVLGRVNKDCPLSKDQTRAQISVDYAKREVARKEELYIRGVISKSELDPAKNQLLLAELELKRSQEQSCAELAVSGGEGDTFLVFETIKSSYANLAATWLLVDTPPSKMSFKGKGPGKYTIKIWGQ